MRLAGQYHDQETGLHQNRRRCYDPKLGRYLSPDPLGLVGGLNLYAYAGNDPVNSSDPLGLFPSITDVASRVLGAKTGGHASQAYSQVQNLLHPHLSAATPPFMSAGPSPFGMGGLGSLPGLKPLNLGVPAYQPPTLPGLAPASIPGLNGTSLFGQGINGPLPTDHLHAQHAKHNHRTTLHPPAPAKAAHACAPKPNAAPAALPPAPPNDAAHRPFWQNIGPSARGVGKNLVQLPAVAGNLAKAETLGVGNFAEKAGDAAMYGANSVLGNKQAAAGYYRAADRADAREQTAGQPVLDFFTAATPGTLKDLTTAAAENAGGQPEAGKKVLHSIVPNTEHAFHDDPVQTTLNATVVLDGAGGVLGSAGKLAGAGRVGSGLSKAGEAARYMAEGGPVGRGMRTVGGKAGSAALRKLSPERQAAAQRAIRAATTVQERRGGGTAPVRREGEPHTDESRTAAEKQFQDKKARLLAQSRRNTLLSRRPALNMTGARAQPMEAARPSGGSGAGTSPALGRPSVLMMAGRPGVPLVQARLGPTRQMRLRGRLRTRMQALLERRQRAILLRDRLIAERQLGPLTLDKTNQLRRARYDVNDASRQLGERASDNYIKTNYPTARKVYPDPGSPSRAGDFDQVWRESGTGPNGQDKWIVIESKGGGSQLGTREINSTDYEQGTRDYFVDVARNMRDSGEQTGTDLLNALRSNSVEYVKVQAPIGTRGGTAVLRNVKINPFQI